MQGISVKPINAFSDNYIWMIIDEKKKEACVVDPGDPDPVLEQLSKDKLSLSSILVTHHHFDHTGGLQALKEKTQCAIYGPDSKVPGIEFALKDRDSVKILGLEFHVIEVPGHTLDHIAYYHAGEAPFLFCGDTLFAGGCGRVFEGTHSMMHESLSKLSALPKNTLIYCAHEYTEANLRFAKEVEPSNAELDIRYDEVLSLRARDQITLPSTIDLENKTNPFLRCATKNLLRDVKRQRDLTSQKPEDVFSILRSWKDDFS